VLGELGLGRARRSLAQLERIQALLALLSWPGPDPALTRYLEIERGSEGDEYNEYKERPVLPDPLGVLRSAAPSVPSMRSGHPVEPGQGGEAAIARARLRSSGWAPGVTMASFQPEGAAPTCSCIATISPGG